jgi:MoaA/NifB/PqqE/SkfB family radical SAM enzyme
MTLGTMFHRHAIVRKDGDTWVGFNGENGDKIRLSFSEGSTTDKGKSPELVDLKITDFCDQGCPFCYQDSSMTGKHASLKNIKQIIKQLRINEVFEVALGGGEPTKHPKFDKILDLFKPFPRIRVSLSTRNKDFLTPENLNKYRDIISAIGFSTESVDDLLELREMLNGDWMLQDERYVSFYNSQVRIHFVCGSLNKEDTIEFLETANRCKIDVLLLGWKNYGRGKNIKPHPYKDWILKEVKRIGFSHIGVDTCLAEECSEDLTDYKLYVVDNEGKYSMYIDSVNMTMAPSSYADFSEPWGDDWIEKFGKY